MAKPFDTTTRELLEGYPGAWLAFLGLVPDGPIRVIDSALAAVTYEADKVFLIDGPVPYLIHIELQAADRTLPRRLLRYNVLLDLQHNLRVLSIAVPLRPQAHTDNLTGLLDERLPDGSETVKLYYKVVRPWLQPVEPILAGGLGTLPLAPLADVPRERVPEVIARIDQRLVQEAPVATAGRIMNATLLLAGLRIEQAEINSLRGRLQTMNIATESSYYWLVVEEGLKKGREEGRHEGLTMGKSEEARRIILRQGTIKFGAPTEADRKRVEAIDDPGRLEALCERLLAVTSWEELLRDDQGNAPGSP